jgi:hypothetical protein
MRGALLAALVIAVFSTATAAAGPRARTGSCGWGTYQLFEVGIDGRGCRGLAYPFDVTDVSADFEHVVGAVYAWPAAPVFYEANLDGTGVRRIGTFEFE